MIDLKKDKKSTTWTITKTDKEGFHRQLSVTEKELDQLVHLWTGSIPESITIPSI